LFFGFVFFFFFVFFGVMDWFNKVSRVFFFFVKNRLKISFWVKKNMNPVFSVITVAGI